jgi:hypothetical protein
MPDTSSSSGNCPPLHYHPDLRGHQPDPAHGHGPPAPQVAAQIASDDRLVRTAYDHRPLLMGARAWLSGAWRGSAQHLAQWCHGRVPSAGRGGSVRVRVGGLVWHRGNGAVGGRARRSGSTWIRTRCSRLGHESFLSQLAGAVSPSAVADFAVAGTLRPVAGSPVTVAAGPGSWPGSVDQEPDESAEARHCERHGHQRSR